MQDIVKEMHQGPMTQFGHSTIKKLDQEYNGSLIDLAEQHVQIARAIDPVAFAIQDFRFAKATQTSRNSEREKTSLDRSLVAPDALQRVGEQFEVSGEFVTVKRVLSPSEISALKVLTQVLKDFTSPRINRLEEAPEEVTHSLGTLWNESTGTIRNIDLSSLAWENETNRSHKKVSPWFKKKYGLSKSLDGDGQHRDKGHPHEISIPLTLPSQSKLNNEGSAPMVDGEKAYSKPLVSLVLEDPILRALCIRGISNLLCTPFESRLEILLERFGSDLSHEAITNEQRYGAYFLVESQASGSALVICRALEQFSKPAAERISLAMIPEHIHGELAHLVGDIENFDEFLKTSQALSILKQKLEIVVIGDPAYSNVMVPTSLTKKPQPLTLGTISSGDAYTNAQNSNRFKKPIDYGSKDPEKRLGSKRIEIAASKDIKTRAMWRNWLLSFDRRPPLKPGNKRIEWQCICGQNIWDDFKELTPGAADVLRQRLVRTKEQRIVSNKSSGNNIIGKLLRGLKSGFGILSYDFSRETNKAGLPFQEANSTSRTGATSEGEFQPTIPSSAPEDLLWLLLCYSHGRYATRLSQLDLFKNNANSDKKLFGIMRELYSSVRGRWTEFASLRTLKRIKFVQFEIYRSELVDVRREDAIPPPENTEYRYQPAPPDLIPPIGENHLLHYFHHPDHAEDETICFNRFPKKVKERLKCTQGVRDGWGLQFVEGWDSGKIWILAFVVFGLGSLLMGVLWAYFKHSIQDAFSIAAYMLAFATVSIGTAQAMFFM